MKNESLDQFYTRNEIAERCVGYVTSFVDKEGIIFGDWLEPSAGQGAFFDILPTLKDGGSTIHNKLGIDIEPKADGILSGDFLDFKLPREDYITIGNPPFGRNASLALKFLNKAAKHSVLIAFILPRSFKKSSIVERIDQNFHLVFEEDLPLDSFEHHGVIKDIPCVFQIWRRLDVQRKQECLEISHEDIIFTKSQDATVAFQRIGRNAGQLKDDLNVSKSSHYFLKVSAEVRQLLSEIDWGVVKYNTAGNPSIAKRELIQQYRLKIRR